MSQAQELGLKAQVLDVVPPGPIHRNRRSSVAKFSHRIPNFRDPGSTFALVPDPRAGAVAELAAKKKEETVSRLRAATLLQQQQQRVGPDIKVPLLLEQRDTASGGSGPPAVVFKGVPEGGGGANVEGPPLHYVLFRSGNRVTAFPADQWLAFKPHVDRRGLVDSVAAANAAAAGKPPASGKDAKAPMDPFALRLVPKSQRMEKQRQEEEARERQEQVAAGRLLPLAGAVDDELGGGGRLKRFVDEDELEAELFGGGDDEDEAPRFGGKGGKGVGKKGRARGLKTADGEELGEDEVPEDLYAGPAADEDLRPEKPEEAEDWEHEFAPDDDDQDQGQDEVYDDDPGMRKKLGIEGDDEDEGEEADEQERKLKKLGDPDDEDEEEEQKKKEEEEAKRKAAAAAAAGAGTSAEEDEQEEEDEDELDELDEMEEEPKPPSARPAAVPPPAASKPPVAPGAAAAVGGAGAAAAGTKRKVPEESTKPAAEAAKRARTATPPPAAAAGAGAAAGAPAARSATPGAAAAGGAAQGAAAAAQRPGVAGAPAGGAGGAAAGPAVTAEEVIELLRRQPNGIMPFQDFTRYFAKRTTTPELRAGLKSLTVSLCKSSKNEAGQLLVSLKK